MHQNQVKGQRVQPEQVTKVTQHAEEDPEEWKNFLVSPMFQ